MFREPQLARPIWIPVQGQERLQNHLEPRIIARPKKKTKNLPNHQFLQCRLWLMSMFKGEDGTACIAVLKLPTLCSFNLWCKLYSNFPTCCGCNVSKSESLTRFRNNWRRLVTSLCLINWKVSIWGARLYTV